MHHFYYNKNELYCEQVPVKAIVAKTGTPVYIYSKRTFVENYESINTLLKKLNDYLICYALKANPNNKIVSILANAGAGADIVSAGELYIALNSGIPSNKIVYAGVGKTDDEIEYALNENILCFNVESTEEIKVIDQIAGKLNKTAAISIRINANISVDSHPYITTGKINNKFGIAINQIEEVVDSLKDLANIRLIGLHSHIGSQILTNEYHLKSILVLSKIKENIEKGGYKIEFMNIGGGFGVNYQDVLKNRETSDFENIFKSLVPELKHLKCTIIFEPGRSIIANAGILITKVLYKKNTSLKKFVIVDAGMTELIRPCLYDAYHEILPVTDANNTPETVDIVGPICESGDFLAKDRSLPFVMRGDLLAIMTVGAYGFSLSSNYNSRLKSPEVLVEEDKFSILSEREKLESLLR